MLEITFNAIGRLQEGCRRKTKTQCLLPCSETACMLFRKLLASGEITLRNIDGWQALKETPHNFELDRAAQLPR